MKLFGYVYPAFLLSLLLTNQCVSAAEAPTKEVLQLCRSQLSSERDAVLVDWSTGPMPPEYRQAARAALGRDVQAGWLAHNNPNGTLTVVIRLVDPETKERNFAVLIRDKQLIMKYNVYAFEFAFSRREQDGVTGLFFCSKTGPSAEWVWNGNDWKVAK